MTRREFLARVAAGAVGAGAVLGGGVASTSPTVRNVGMASSEMRYRELGRTGIRISDLGFGSHLDRKNMNDPEGRAGQIRKGLDLGINLFDIYEHSYHQFGLMSEVLGPVREDCVISLVSVSIWQKGAPDRERAKRAVLAEVEESLTTFHTDAIDLYRLVSTTNRAEVEVTFLALQEAKQQGKIRAVGAVCHEIPETIGILQDFPELDYIMLPYNFRHHLFDVPTPIEAATWGRMKRSVGRGGSPKPLVDYGDEVAPSEALSMLIERTGVGVIAIKPFAKGALLNLSPPDPAVKELIENEGLNVPQAALRFILDNRLISSVIPAMNSIEEVTENAAAVPRNGLSKAEARLLEIYDRAAAATRGRYLPEGYGWLEQWSV